jgi:hypothetical protein
VISLGALLVSFLALLAAIGTIVGKLLYPDVPHGVPTIIVVCLFLGSIQLLSISFVAEYVGKIFEEVKRRPPFVVTRLRNFDSPERDGEVQRSREMAGKRDMGA